MNKLTFSILVWTVALSAQAQNSQRLSTDRNAYRADDQVVKQQVEFKDPGSSGRNLNWDFRFLQPVNEYYSLNYFIPDSTQMNRICGLEHNTRYYYQQQQDSLWATGFENATIYMEYVKPELRLRFPFSYGDTLFSAFEGVGQYCHRLELAVTGYTRVIADAQGELMLPDWETVQNALRVHTIRHYTETGKDSTEMTLDTYSWYAEGMRYPVFESVKTTLLKHPSSLTPSPQGEGAGGDVSGGVVNDTTVFSTSFYYPPVLQTSQVQTDPLSVSPTSAVPEGAASVFTQAQYLPNPVISNLYVSYKLTRNAQVWFTLTSQLGVPVTQTTPQQLSEGEHNNTIYMGGLVPGTYNLYIHVDDMVMKQVVVKK